MSAQPTITTATSVNLRWAAPAVTLALLAGGCDSTAGDVELRIRVYGESYAEARIPSGDVVDGWEIRFDRLLMGILEVEAEGVALDGAFLLDLARPTDGAGVELGAVTVPAEGRPDLGFTVAPLPSAPSTSEADASDVEMMLARGWSVFAEGEATRDGESVRFSWGFDTRARYEACEGTAALDAEAAPVSQLTIHVDHLFYDDLDSPEPNVAFDLVAAADADADGEVTEAELRALPLDDQARYQVGGRDIADLWGFIEAQTRTLGHIDGEGHCERAD